MKKFISMVMAAAMVVSLVPATAFAANDAQFKLINDLEVTTSYAEDVLEVKGLPVADPAGVVETAIEPEIQIKLKDVDSKAGVQDSFEVKLSLNNAEFKAPLKKGATLFEAYVIDDENDKDQGDAKLIKVTLDA
ncbi:MAG: hypothetical protein IJY52_08615, partial [Anaerotignum sp.]|nr:hypothetical protein [Anaerotignum sp.]